MLLKFCLTFILLGISLHKLLQKKYQMCMFAVFLKQITWKMNFNFQINAYIFQC